MLADPIEIGALMSLLQGGSSPEASSAPVTLTAAKSIVGHAEPAAGLVGMSHLARTLSEFAMSPMLHLRTINPYVASALIASSQARRGRSADSQGFAVVGIPRAPAGAPAGLSAAGGASAFAFQVCLRSDQLRI